MINKEDFKEFIDIVYELERLGKYVIFDYYGHLAKTNIEIYRTDEIRQPEQVYRFYIDEKNGGNFKDAIKKLTKYRLVCEDKTCFNNEMEPTPQDQISE